MRVCFFFIIFCISFYPIIANHLWALPNSNNSQWIFALGTKGIYKSGISETNTYYNPFVKADYRTEFLRISSGAGRYINFQITDGYGTYDYVNIDLAELSLDVKAMENLNLSFGYKYYVGESEYIRTDYLFEISYDIEKVSLIGEYNLVKSAYAFHSMDIELENRDYSVEIDYLLTDYISFDAGYTYNSTSLSSLDYDYTKRIFRIGTIPEFYDSVYVVCGLSFGRDSDDYSLFGLDAGVNAYFARHIRLMVLFIFMYYQAPAGIDGGYGVRKGESGGATSGTISYEPNPYLSDSRLGKSYFSQAVSVGITFSF